MKNKQENMKNKDNKKSGVFTQIGASNHGMSGEREANDYYATPASIVEELLKVESFSKHIYEVAVGDGAIARVLENHGYKVKGTDLIYRGYGEGNVDFLSVNKPWFGSIMTNCPYSLSKEFILKSLSLIKPNEKAAFLLPINFLEGKKRKQLFTENPPARIYVSRSRVMFAKNNDWEAIKGKSSAMCFAWFVWVKNFSGNTTISWIN